MGQRFLKLALLFILAVSASQAEEQDGVLARGKYLIEGIVGCGHCHTPKSPDGTLIAEKRLSGAYVIDMPGLKSYAPNITMDEETGIGAWSDDEIVRAIRDGIRPDGTIIGPLMPNIFYRNMSDNDVRAIVAYMRNVIPPVHNVVPRSEFGFTLPDSWGPPIGEVPDVTPDDGPLAYGTYVATALGHCNGCHTPAIPGGRDFNRTGAGGEVFPDIFGLGFTAVAANITPHPVLGLGAWSDDEKTSHHPRH